MVAPTASDYFMKNLSRKKHTENTDQESPKELATQGYQRRFFNSSPLVRELAAAFDQVFAEREQFLTQEIRDSQSSEPETESDDFISPIIKNPAERQ